jgi:hypothetical protein
LNYLSVIGCSLSILANAILGGQYNQTFSARNWEWKRQGRFNLVVIIDALHYHEPDHCMMSYIRWLHIQEGLHRINDMHRRIENTRLSYISR